LGDVVVDTRSGFACGEDPDRGILQLRMHNVNRSCALDFKKRRLVPDGKVKPDDLLRPGDVLFNATNSPDGVGKSALVREIVEPLVFSNHFLRLRTDAERLLPEYLARWLQIRFEHGLFQSMCRQWVNQATVGREALLSLPIALPSLPEQRRIAEALDRVDALRTKRRQALALLDDLPQSIFYDMIGQHSSRKTWASDELRSVVRKGTAVTYGIVQAGEEAENGVPYIRTGDLVDGGIRLEGLRHTAPEIASKFQRSTVDPGDLVMSIRATVGTTAMVPDVLAGANLTQGTARIAPGDRVSPGYLLEYLRSGEVQSWIKQQIKGATFLEITLGKLRELQVLLPPKELQESFDARMRGIDQLRAAGRVDLCRLDDLFASLQRRAFAEQL